MKNFLKKFLVYTLASMMILPTWLVISLIGPATAKAAAPVTIVGWDFNDSNSIADSGIDANLTRIVSASGVDEVEYYLSSPHAPYAKGWNGTETDKYWSTSFVSLGYKDLSLSWKQKSSSSGPMEFKAQYSLNETIWHDLDSYTLGTSYKSLGPVSLAGECDNKSIVYLRWLKIGDFAANEGMIASTGTNSIDAITVTGVVGDFDDPVISGVENGKHYNHPVVISFNEGTGSLTKDGGVENLFLSGQTLSVDGHYELTVTDESGNTTEVHFTIDQTAPIITLNGSPKIVLSTAGVFADQGATALDETDGDLSDQIVRTHSGYVDGAPGTYFFYYNVMDKAGNAAETVTRTVVVVESEDVIPTPENLSPANGAILRSKDFAKYSWTEIVNENIPVSYFFDYSISPEIDQETGLFVEPINPPVLLDKAELATAFTPEGTIYWHVIAIDTEENLSGWSDIWMVTIDDTAPTDPTEVVAKSTRNTVDIKWTASTDENGVAGYNIYRIDKPTIKLNADLITANTYTDINVADGEYYYFVRAIDRAGNLSENAGYSNLVTVNNFFPAAPKITSITGDDKAITLTWESVANAEGYVVYVSADPSVLGTKATEKLSVLTAKISVADYGTYYVKVVAIATNGNESKSAEVIAAQKSITLSAPVVAPVVEEKPVTIAPKAAVAAPEENQSITGTGKLDDDGQIKGDETSDTDPAINWTPWIILFILIILAGAVTGGYFYWFAGKEEIEDEDKTVKKEVVKEDPKPSVVVTTRDKRNKKQKRW